MAAVAEVVVGVGGGVEGPPPDGGQVVARHHELVGAQRDLEHLHGLADGAAEEEAAARPVEVGVRHGDADEDDVGQVGEHRRQEHEVAELLAEAGP